MNLKILILLSVLTFLKLIQANHHHDHDKAGLKDHHTKKSIEPKFAWHQLRFKDLPSDSDDLEEEFIPYNNVPMGVSKWGDKLIITVPRRKPGIPSTLNYIKLKQHSSKHEDNHNIDVPLIPYPNLDINKLRLTPTPDTFNLVSIYRTTVDECDRLWMVDTGLLEYTRNRTYVRSPRILILDLNKNEFIHQFEMADELHTPKSTFASIAVDVTPNHCDQTFAYIPDLSANQVVVYDMKNQKAWKVNHDSFHGEPDGGKFDINGLQFQLPDGIFSIALSPHQEAGLRTAYYHALASTKEYSVSTNVLKNQSKFNDKVFIRLGDKGIKQETNCFVMDQKTGVLFYNQVVYIADIDAENGENIVKTLVKKYGNDRVKFLKLDVMQLEEFQNVFETIINESGRLDILINNAGVLISSKLFDINIGGVLNGLKLAMRFMKKGSKVINTASTAGLSGAGQFPEYTASKYAVIGLTKAFSTNYWYDKTQISVMAICPGMTATLLINVPNTEEYEDLYNFINRLKINEQLTESVAKSMITILKVGTNGSFWLAENNKLFELEFPWYLNLIKNEVPFIESN